MKNKILIATGIYPPDIGGPATILPTLKKDLKQKGLDVKIITYSNILLKEKNVVRIPKSRFGRLEYLLRMFFLSFSSSVIYVMDVYSVGYFACLVKKMTGKKYVVRFVGDSAWETAVANGWTSDYIVDFQKKTYDQKIERLKARRKKILVNAEKVVVVSKFLSSIAEAIGVKKEKIRLIYNAVDFVKDESLDLQREKDVKQEFPQGSKIIVTACRLALWKGVDGIIRIMPELKKSFGNIFLLILGDGPESENLKKMAFDLGVEKNVIFKGRIEHEQMIDYFKIADLFILNTNYEGMSHTLLEAMRFGAPIVTTDIGGNPELIENNKEGILVEYNNDSQLMSAVKKILSDVETARTFSANARKKQEDFKWENTVEETASLLKQTGNE